MATMDDVRLESIVSKPTWKQILMELMLTERIDPWNIDIVTIADGFLKRIREMKKLDLMLPANVILASAILLRYKSDYLRIYDPQPVQALLPEGEEGGAIEEIPQLVMSSRIPPKRQISLEELVQEIESVIKYEDVVRVQKRKGGIDEFVNFQLNGHDLDKGMSEMFEKIKTSTDETGWVLFSRLVDKQGTTEMIYALLSVLYLTQKEVIDIKQDKIFGEIFIHLLQEKIPN